MPPRFRPALHRLIGCLVLTLLVSSSASAQRNLRWDRFDVDATLDASGTLDVTETQTMVFDGAWNGGERRFDVRPRQRFTFIGIWRIDADGRHPLEERGSLSFVDDFAWADQTLRWRSRLPDAPPFANTTLRYEIRYKLSGILLRDDTRYTLDHDFAFRDRNGPIEQFALRLTLDPAWQPLEPVAQTYAVGPLAPGQSFVLTLPMRFTGRGAPEVLDLTRPPAIATGIPLLLGFAGLAVLWFFAREQMHGRFEPVPIDQVNASWLGEHLLRYPAEIVGAAWDEWVGPPEVVALLARLESEGKIASSVGKTSRRKTPMALRLLCSRESLAPHERKLVDALFFDGGTETSSQAVQRHYQRTGFNPAAVIERELRRALDAMLPANDHPRRFGWVSALLFFGGLILMLLEWFAGRLGTAPLLVTLIAGALLTGIALWAGSEFRKHLEWGRTRAWVCMLPALAIVVGVAAFLWYYPGLGRVEMRPRAIYGQLVVAAGLILVSIDAAKSRQRSAGMALRKRFAAARAFFAAELRQANPALRDEWRPWLLAFGLTKEMQAWSADRPSASHARTSSSFDSSTSTSSSTATNWTGFGGGRSGGGGASGAWEVAAAGMAAGIAAPSSSGSGGSSSSGGGSSSGGSSGGGGGGGW